MRGWKKIDDAQYSYSGFNIHFTSDIIDRRAVDVMRAEKKVKDEQEENQEISFKASGDSFEEVKEKMVEKIDAFNSAHN